MRVLEMQTAPPEVKGRTRPGRGCSGVQQWLLAVSPFGFGKLSWIRGPVSTMRTNDSFLSRAECYIPPKRVAHLLLSGGRSEACTSGGVPGYVNTVK